MHVEKEWLAKLLLIYSVSLITYSQREEKEALRNIFIETSEVLL